MGLEGCGMEPLDLDLVGACGYLGIVEACRPLECRVLVDYWMVEASGNSKALEIVDLGLVRMRPLSNLLIQRAPSQLWLTAVCHALRHQTVSLEISTTGSFSRKFALRLYFFNSRPKSYKRVLSLINNLMVT